MRHTYGLERVLLVIERRTLLRKDLKREDELGFDHGRFICLSRNWGDREGGLPPIGSFPK